MSYDIQVNYDVCKHKFFHFRIKSKYLIVRKCLFCDFLQIKHTNRCMLNVHRSEYLSTLYDENNVRCQSLYVCKHCLVFLTLFPIYRKIGHGCLNSMVAKFQDLRYSHQKSRYFVFPSKHWHNVIFSFTTTRTF